MFQEFTIITTLADGTATQRSLRPGTYYVGCDHGCQIVVESWGVAPRHVRLRLDADEAVIADLNSASGTKVNGVPLKGERSFFYPQTLQIGDATLKVEQGDLISIKIREQRPRIPEPPAEYETLESVRILASNFIIPKPPPLPVASEPVSAETFEEEEEELFEDRDVSGIHESSGSLETDEERPEAPVPSPPEEEGLEVRRQQFFTGLPGLFAAVPDLKKLCPPVLFRVLMLMPEAERGALFIFDPPSGKLALRAAVPEDDPPVNRAQIQRAAAEQQGFIWREEKAATSSSVGTVHNGIHVPLVYGEDSLGVLAVDNGGKGGGFDTNDLGFLSTVAQYLASMVAERLG